VVPAWQLPLTSQHPEQLEALHPGFLQNPPLHVSPEGQMAQALPPTPHCDGVPPAWHLPLGSQQPVQFEALHAGLLQYPPLHVSPGGHGLQLFPPSPQ